MSPRFSKKYITKAAFAFIGLNRNNYHPLRFDFEDRYKAAVHSNPSSAAIGKSERGEFRVSAWNVNLFSSIDAVLESVHSNRDLTNSDVIALQEVKATDDGANLLERVKEETGFGYAYCIECVGLDGTKPEIAVAVLSRHKVVETSVLRLDAPKSSKLNGNWYLGTPVALQARVIKDGRQVTVYSLHLELCATYRKRRIQLVQILEDAEKHRDLPAVMAGDFNFVFEGQNNSTMKLARKYGFEDPIGAQGLPTISPPFWKFVAQSPFNIILRGRGVLDRIMSRGLEPLHTAVHYNVNSSDHHPITAVYRF